MQNIVFLKVHRKNANINYRTKCPRTLNYPKLRKIFELVAFDGYEEGFDVRLSFAEPHWNEIIWFGPFLINSTLEKCSIYGMLELRESFSLKSSTMRFTLTAFWDTFNHFPS